MKYSPGRLVAAALLACGLALQAGAAALQIDWIELVPADKRATFDPAPPPPAHDYLTGESGGLAAQQPLDFSVNMELEGKEIRIPGFVVPLELDDAGNVTEFFLVPYFGACIHVPPPPPNQMLYVRMKQGIKLDSMYSAYWITGKLSARTRATRLGSAAYMLAGTEFEEYKF
jgi:uncharacterized protein